MTTPRRESLRDDSDGSHDSLDDSDSFADTSYCETESSFFMEDSESGSLDVSGPSLGTLESNPEPAPKQKIVFEKRKSSGMDDLALELQNFNTQEKERQAEKRKERRRKKQKAESDRCMDDQSESDHSRLSLGSNKSLPLTSYLRCQEESCSELDLSELGSSADDAQQPRRVAPSGLIPPKEKLLSLFGELSFFKKETFSWDTYFQQSQGETTEDARMDHDLQTAIQTGDLEQLRHLWECGVSMGSRNKQGETVAHLVCRNSSAELLAFLITEAKVSFRVRDHQAKKTPLHEIAWSPDFEPSLAMSLISAAPELLWAPDCRGFTPLEYVPKRTLNEWYSFLEAKRAFIKQALVFSRWKDSSIQMRANLERLQGIIDRHEALSKN